MWRNPLLDEAAGIRVSDPDGNQTVVFCLKFHISLQQPLGESSQLCRCSESIETAGELRILVLQSGKRLFSSVTQTGLILIGECDRIQVRRVVLGRDPSEYLGGQQFLRFVSLKKEANQRSHSWLPHPGQCDEGLLAIHA